MRDAVASVRSSRSSAEPVPTGSRPFSGGYGRAELAGLYARVAETLERSAQLAEQHAQHERSKAGWPRLPSNWSAPSERAKLLGAGARWPREGSEATITALLRRDADACRASSCALGVSIVGNERPCSGSLPTDGDPSVKGVVVLDDASCRSSPACGAAARSRVFGE
jgi:hypothetical protein